MAVPPVRPPRMPDMFMPIQSIPQGNSIGGPPLCPPFPPQNHISVPPPPQQAFQNPPPHQLPFNNHPPPQILPAGPSNVHGRTFTPRIGYTWGDTFYSNRLHIFHCLVCRTQHNIATPCPYIVCCPRHRTLYVHPNYAQDKAFQQHHPHLLISQSKCAECQVEKVGFSSIWINHMGMEISAFQARQQPRLTCPVCLQKPTSTLGEYCENHLTRCPIHHQLFVSRHVDKHYFRHLVKEDFVCLECFARGAPEGRAKERYRGLRDQFERVLWESGFWRYDDRNQEQSFWGALGGLLGGLM